MFGAKVKESIMSKTPPRTPTMTTRRSPPPRSARRSSVCRRLTFSPSGPSSRLEPRGVYEREMEYEHQKNTSKWNYDFKQDKPLPGRYEWQLLAVEGPLTKVRATNTTPRKSPCAKLRGSPKHKSSPKALRIKFAESSSSTSPLPAPLPPPGCQLHRCSPGAKRQSPKSTQSSPIQRQPGLDLRTVVVAPLAAWPSATRASPSSSSSPSSSVNRKPLANRRQSPVCNSENMCPTLQRVRESGVARNLAALFWSDDTNNNNNNNVRNDTNNNNMRGEKDENSHLTTNISSSSSSNNNNNSIMKPLCSTMDLNANRLSFETSVDVTSLKAGSKPTPEARKRRQSLITGFFCHQKTPRLRLSDKHVQSTVAKAIPHVTAIDGHPASQNVVCHR